MPQTEEHLQILSYLGVARAVVALTKIDLAEDEPASLAQLREKLRGSPFAAAPIVPTSIVSGRGLEELKSTLAAVLSRTPPPRDIAKPRLSVDRAFTLRGIGTIVTGTLTAERFGAGRRSSFNLGPAARIRSSRIITATWKQADREPHCVEPR
jgi:selenocysteine-specific elongation factor